MPALLALVFGAALFLVMTDGGREVRAARPLVEEVDRFAESLGLAIQQVSITGHSHTTDDEIFRALDVGARSLLGFDASVARQRLERLPWVRSALIERVFPDAIEVKIIERQPFAIWRRATSDLLIDSGGYVLASVASDANMRLPIVVGEGAATLAHAFLSLVGAHPDLAQRFAHAELVAGRRWRLVVQGGPVIELPADGEVEALETLLAPRPGPRLVDLDIEVVDLRLAREIVVQRAQKAKVSAASPR